VALPLLFAMLASATFVGRPVPSGLRSTSALPQVKWDLAAEAGVVKRITTGGSSGASSPGVGPGFGVAGHVALVPMVRVGLYAAMDLAPAAGAGGGEIGQRNYWEGGLQLRLVPPLLPAPWRTWAFAGVGFAYTYAQSYELAGPQGNVSVEGVSGGMLDVPLGLGLGYRLMAPWSLFVQAAAHIGAGFYGPMYAGAPGVSGSNSAGISPAFAGHDSFALSLSLGVSFDP
jgi:hypothetical protein